jgi:hypothetical protein
MFYTLLITYEWIFYIILNIWIWTFIANQPKYETSLVPFVM